MSQMSNDIPSHIKGTLQKKSTRKPMPRESYQFSGGVLATSLVLAYKATEFFDGTETSKEWSRTMKSTLWQTPHVVAIGIVVAYFLIVAWHLYVRPAEAKERARSLADVPGCNIGHALIIWNYFLTGFSMLLLTGLARGVYEIVSQHGVVAYLCDGELAWDADKPFGLYMALFMLSKFPELIDTMFLIVRGRPLLFLHWYHHISVLLYCWLATQTKYPGTPFAVINAFVHSIMYYYYARTAQGVKPAFARIVTQIQLLQMAAGLTINGMFMFLHFNRPDSCTGGSTIHETGLLNVVFLATGAMYMSYFILFGMFYFQRYLHNKNK